MYLEKPITAALVAATATAYYTADANLKRVVIKKVTFYNSNTVAETITLHLVPSGGSASATNMLINARSLATLETWECYEAEGQCLLGGGMIQCLSSTASKINIQGMVLERTS